MATRRALITGTTGHRVTLIPGDLLDQLSLTRALEKSQPHEVLKRYGI